MPFLIIEIYTSKAAIFSKILRFFTKKTAEFVYSIEITGFLRRVTYCSYCIYFTRHLESHPITFISQSSIEKLH